MNVKLTIIAVLALFACVAVQAQSLQPNLLPAPQLVGGGNQYGATIGVVGVPITPSVQGSATVTTTIQPHVEPKQVTVGVTIQHDVGGK